MPWPPTPTEAVLLTAIPDSAAEPETRPAIQADHKSRAVAGLGAAAGHVLSLAILAASAP